MPPSESSSSPPDNPTPSDGLTPLLDPWHLRQEIIITFRDVPHLPVGFSGPSRPAQLRIGIKPATLELDLVTNGRDDPFDLEWEVLSADFGESELSAYGEVLAELMDGDPTLSVRGDIAEECWRIITPVLAAWRKNAVPLDSYPAGSAGPRRWRDPQPLGV